MIRFFKQRTQTTQPLTTDAARTTLSPLDITEILELIFSYLDDNTIRHSVVLVCRQWRLLNQEGRLREVYWQEDWKSTRKERAARKLPGAGRLHCCLPTDSRLEAIFNNNKDSIRKVLGQLEAQYQKQLAQRKRRITANATNKNKQLSSPWIWTGMPRTMSTLYAFTPLRELNIFIHFNHWESLNTFPFPASLVRLSIAINFAFYAEFDLSWVLKSCSLLENLSVETYATPGVTLNWSTPFGSTTAPTPTTTTTTPTALAAPQSLPLRSLVLSHALLAQDHLENLLPHTPNLKELKLKGMMWFDSRRYDWTRLASCLHTNNIILDNAHFSMFRTETTPEETEYFMAEVHSQSTRDLTLWARDVTPQLLQTLFFPPTTSILTSLELYWKHTDSSFAFDLAYMNREELSLAPGLIYRYLCESDCFVHLTTLKTAVQHEDLDLYGRAEYIGLDKDLDDKAILSLFQDLPSSSPSSPPSSSPSPMVWRCRRLHTLYIHVLCPKKHMFEHAAQSRIVYGYISRVCPLLEELQICFPQDDQPNQEGCLDLKAGLCLLGRLRYLKKLWVYSNTMDMDVATGCKDWDVNWIVDSGRRNALSRRSRQKEVEGWRMWRINEDKVETERERIRQLVIENENSNNYSGSSSSSRSITVTDTAILGQLRNLGLLLDVEEMLKEIDEGGHQVMPFLERLSFKYPIMMRPEEELRRLFPSSRLERWRGYRAFAKLK